MTVAEDPGPQGTTELQRLRQQLQSSQRLLEVQGTLIEQLSHSESRFRQLVELLSDGLALLDPELRILYANPALEQLLDQNADSLVGIPLAQFVMPQDRPAGTSSAAPCWPACSEHGVHPAPRGGWAGRGQPAAGP